MPCYSPKPAAVLLANKKQAPDPMPQTLSCGKCIGCRKRQKREWSTRLYHESQLHSSSCFITLTYGPDHIPPGNTLVKDHTTKFLKRLRKRITATWPDDKPKHHAFRYYLVGEYGDSSRRPHYHAVLFGYAFPDRKLWMQRDGDRPVFRSELLEDTWRYGYSEIEPVTPGAMAYVAGYVTKKLQKPDHEKYDPTTGLELQPEYAVMSRRPGIGHGWLQKYWTDVYPSDFVIVDGNKSKPPLYYDRWLEKHHPDILDQVKEARRAHEHIPYESTTARLKAREICAMAREKPRDNAA